MLCPKYIPTTDIIAWGNHSGVTIPCNVLHSVTVLVKSKNNILKPVVTSTGTTVGSPRIGAVRIKAAILMKDTTKNLRIHCALGVSYALLRGCELL